MAKNGRIEMPSIYFISQSLAHGRCPLDRMLAFMEKAVREAKQHTTWTEPNGAYEAALGNFITDTLRNSQFLRRRWISLLPAWPTPGT